MDIEQRNEALEKILSVLPDKEKVFVVDYCRYMSRVHAARAMGYEGENARQMGYEVRHRPRVSAAIKEYLSLTKLSAEDNEKLITRIAESDISEYFEPVTEYVTKKVRVPLGEYIVNLEEEIEYLDEVLLEPGLTKLEATESLQNQKAYRRQINKYKSKLSKDPGAYRVDYRDVEVTSKKLNLDRLVEDKVPIKSVKHTKDGVVIETYSAADSQDRLARINGSFEKDNKQKPVISNTTGHTAEQLSRLTKDELKTMAAIENKLNA